MMAADAMKRIEEIDEELRLILHCHGQVAVHRAEALSAERVMVQTALQVMLSPARDFDSSTVH